MQFSLEASWLVGLHLKARELGSILTLLDLVHDGADLLLIKVCVVKIINDDNWSAGASTKALDLDEVKLAIFATAFSKGSLSSLLDGLLHSITLVDVAGETIASFEPMLPWLLEPVHVIESSSFVNTANWLLSELSNSLNAAPVQESILLLSEVKKWQDGGFLAISWVLSENCVNLFLVLELKLAVDNCSTWENVRKGFEMA